MNCPICAGASVEMTHLKCADFDGSPLYQDIRLRTCNECHHVFNELTTEEKLGIGEYYEKESSLINMSGTTFHGDLPGSDNTLSIQRYEQVYKFLSNHISREMRILDVGCGMGGFVRFLHSNGYTNTEGVDFLESYIRFAQNEGPGTFHTASAYSLPFEDSTYDLIILDHVLEHVLNPVQVMSELKRVSRRGGLVYIGVPAASQYGDYPFFDFFWLCLREHIHHFDAAAISFLTASFNLAPVDQAIIYSQMMSGAMILPNSLSLFRNQLEKVQRDSISASQNLISKMEDYIETEAMYLEKHKRVISSLVDKKVPTYVWGIGKELFCLYANTELKYCTNLTLIDKNQVKQTSMKLDGQSILGNSILESASKDSVLIVAAVAHEDSIIKEAGQIGYKGNIITLGRT